MSPFKTESVHKRAVHGLCSQRSAAFGHWDHIVRKGTACIYKQTSTPGASCPDGAATNFCWRFYELTYGGGGRGWESVFFKSSLLEYHKHILLRIQYYTVETPIYCIGCGTTIRPKCPMPWMSADMNMISMVAGGRSHRNQIIIENGPIY
jgi:hypothetical protein